MAAQVHEIRVPVQPEVRALRALARTWNGVQPVYKLLSKRNMIRTRIENRDCATATRPDINSGHSGHTLARTTAEVAFRGSTTLKSEDAIRTL